MKTSATMRRAADLIWKLRAGDDSKDVVGRALVDDLHAGAAKLEKAAQRELATRPGSPWTSPGDLLAEIGELER